MGRYLYPQFNRAQVRACHAMLQNVSTTDALTRVTESDIDRNRTIRAVGGDPVPDEKLLGLRDKVVELATECGYPQPRTQTGQHTFDARAAELLYQEMDIIPGEAARHEVWQYLACVCLPDVAVWRFGTTDDGAAVNEERLMGGVRNVLGRLWWRAYLFQDPENAEDPFWILDTERGALTEDNFVQLMERPGIASIPGMTLRFAKEFIKRRGEVAGYGANPQQRLLREVMKLFLRYGRIVDLIVLRDSELERVVSELFDETISVIQE